MSKKVLTLLIVLGVTLAFAMISFAAMPPPPVNQNLGLGDTVFNQMDVNDCRWCHNQNPPAPYPVDGTYLPDRHHLRVGQTIIPGSDVPKTDADGDGVPDVTYDCLNCHNVVWDGNAYVIVEDFRDCTTCHIQQQELTVHHRLAQATSGNCQYCHGGFVDSGLLDDDNDGIRNAMDYDDLVTPANGWVPTYQTGIVTPWPSRKNVAGTCSITTTQPCLVVGDCPSGETCIADNNPDMVDHYGTCSTTTTTICREAGDCPGTETCNWPDGIADQSSAGAYAGNCNYCHNNELGGPGAPTTENTGVFAPVEVYRNDETHHSTGFFEITETYCTWCHLTDPPSDGGALQIRTCENCHGIPSLHNIQFATQATGFPSDGTVVPGAEMPWSGHIGNQIDCNGCHGFDNVSVARAFAPQSGPVVPGLYTVSASSVESGASVELGGTAFANFVQNPQTGEYDYELISDVVLTGADGSDTVIQASSVTGDTINVTLDGVAPGNYKIAAKKGSRNSNPMNIAITPNATIDSATCSDGTVTISGSGFSSYLNAADSGTKVEATVTYRVGGKKKGTTVTETLAADISSWSDTGIVGSFPACPDTVDLTTVFDEASSSVTSSGNGGGKGNGGGNGGGKGKDKTK
jgi:hypothetical protein